MNKKVRELLDKKAEENRLIEEQKSQKSFSKQQKEEQKKLKKNNKNKIVNTISKELKKEIVINNNNEDIIQDNYLELKKQSDRTKLFIKFADKIYIDDKYVPTTEKGMDTKAKELLNRLTKKIEKEEDNK